MVLLIGLVILAALAPTIASTAWGRRTVLDVVNPRLRGSLNAQSWKLAWFGECSVRGLSVRDPENREVLQVEGVRLSRGLWQALTTPDSPGDLTVSRPETTLHVAADGSISLVDAFSPVHPQPPKESGGSLDLHTRVELLGGKVQVIFDDGRQAGVSDLEARVDLAGAGPLVGKLSARIDGGGRVQGDLRVEDWLRDGALNTSGAHGEITLAADEAVDLAIVDQLAALGAGLGGSATVQVTGKVEQGRIDGEYKLAMKSLHATTTAETVVSPVDVDLEGRVQLAGRDLSADVSARGAWGKVQARLTGGVDALAGFQPDMDAFAALLAGERRAVTLPAMSLSASGDFDLAVLGRAVPALLRVRPGTEITAGTVTLEQLTVGGGDSPFMEIAINVAELTARADGKAVRCAPIALGVDAISSAERGLEVRRASLNTGFGTITASGTPGDVTAKIDTDLAELHRQLGSIFDISVDELSGAVTASLVAKRGADEQVEIGVEVEADALRYAFQDQHASARKLRATHRGTLAAKGSAQTRGSIGGQFSAAVEGLHLTSAGEGLVQSLDGAAEGNLRLDGDDLETQAKLHGPWGNLEGDLTCDLASLEDVQFDQSSLAALLAGQPARIALPNFVLNARGQFDLARLGAAIPRLLNVRPDTEIRSGALALDELALRGGREPSIKLSAKLSNLTADNAGREVRCAPITAGVDMAAADTGLDVRRAEMTSGFGELSARGTPKEVTAQLNADLAELRTQLAGIFDLGVDELSGKVTAKVAAARGEGDRIRLDVEAQGSELRYAAGERRVVLSRAQAVHRGTVTLQGGALQRIETEQATLSLNDRVQIEAKGWYAQDSATFAADLGLQRADLALLAELAGGAGLDSVRPMSGQLDGKVQLKRERADDPLGSSGALNMQNVLVEGKAVTQRGTCTWRELAFSPDGAVVQAASFDVVSDPLQVAAKNLAGKLGESPELSGNVRVRADLAPLMTLLAGFGLIEPAPGLAGRLTADGDMRTAAGVTEVSGNAEIMDFTAPGETQVAPRGAKLTCDARIDGPKDELTLRTFNLNSELASVQLAGTVSEFSTTRKVNLNGKYRLAWDDVMPLVYAFVPELREMLRLQGGVDESVRLGGSLAAGSSASPIMDLTALTKVGWESASVLGVELGKTSLAPSLQNGVLTLPAGPIPAASGSVRLGGMVDLTQSPPLLRIPGDVALLENVQITPELAESLLSRFNPIFSQATRLSGTANLRVRELELPLGAGVTQGGGGGGTLVLDSFQIAPGGLLAELLALSRLAREMYVVDVSGLEFTVREGRIHYRDLTLRFVQDKFDLKFYGSVGFDDSLDLFVSVPVGETILEKVGLGVGAAEYTRLLAGLRIDVPVGGTRKNPRLDFSQVNVKSILDQAVRKRGEETLTGGGLFDLISGIGGKRNDTKPNDTKANDQQSGTPPAGGAKTEPKSAEEEQKPAPSVGPRSKKKPTPRKRD